MTLLDGKHIEGRDFPTGVNIGSELEETVYWLCRFGAYHLKTRLRGYSLHVPSQNFKATAGFLALSCFMAKDSLFYTVHFALFSQAVHILPPPPNWDKATSLFEKMGKSRDHVLTTSPPSNPFLHAKTLLFKYMAEGGTYYSSLHLSYLHSHCHNHTASGLVRSGCCGSETGRAHKSVHLKRKGAMW